MYISWVARRWIGLALDTFWFEKDMSVLDSCGHHGEQCKWQRAGLERRLKVESPTEVGPRLLYTASAAASDFPLQPSLSRLFPFPFPPSSLPSDRRFESLLCFALFVLFSSASFFASNPPLRLVLIADSVVGVYTPPALRTHLIIHTQPIPIEHTL